MVGDDRDYDGFVFRKIDWARGGPYEWREGDYEELMNSGLLFLQRGERMEGDAE